MDRGDRIYVAGEDTVMGDALCRVLARRGYAGVINGMAGQVDFTDADQVEALFSRWAPEYVFLAAGRSGGISFNQRCPADLIRENLLVAAHVIHSAWRHGVKKLLYLASSCVYPQNAPQPMQEGFLLTGPLEPTSEPYAVARIAGIKLCQAYRRQYGFNCIAAIPADVFGPGDKFSAEDSHVIPALIRRMHEATVLGAGVVKIWGTGSPRREFVFADDVAEACLVLMDAYDNDEPVNIGGGTETSIAEIAGLIQEIVGYPGRLVFDPARPDGMPGKRLDAGKLAALGWRPRTPLRSALEATYEAFLRLRQSEEGSHVRAHL